ncbi:MAG: carbonic anhydrase, partial [Quisquiliibacterium sp.]
GEHIPTAKAMDRLCELNVIEQVRNVCQTSIVQEAWSRQQSLTVHGWIYGVGDGLLRDLSLNVHSADALDAQYEHAIKMIGRG